MADCDQNGSTSMNRSAVANWFYRRETPYALALVRILFPLVMLVAVLPRLPYVRELYSSDGSPSPFWEIYDTFERFPIPSPALAISLYMAMVFLLITTCLGWKTRLSLCGLMFLIPYFGMLDTLGTLTKYTVLATHICLILALSECGSVWSIDSRSRTDAATSGTAPRCEVWPQRLLQLLIGVVYLGAAATKIHTAGFFSGEQMYFWMLTNTNYANPLGEWLSQYPAIVAVIGYVTALWEVLFIFLVWQHPWRRIMLGLGVVFHVMTFFLLGLLVFPLLYLALYCSFLSEADARRVGDFAGSLVPHRGWTGVGRRSVLRLATWPTFAGLLVLLSVVGVAAERQLDVYGERSGEGPVELKPLPEDVVAEILRNDLHLDLADQVYRLDVGTTTMAGYVVDPRSTFEPGEKLFVQARLLPVRSDMWIEYELRNSRGQIESRDGMLVPREDAAANFSVPLSRRLTPGAYTLRILLNGNPVQDKQLRIAGD